MSEWSAAASDDDLATCALCCAGITAFLKARFDGYFDDQTRALLAEAYPTAELAAATTWEEAEAFMRRHQVTGGLTVERRRELFEAHRESLS